MGNCIINNVPTDIPGIGSVSLSFMCNHCGKYVTGGEYITGVFYCPMCASIIKRNNVASQKGTLVHILLEDKNPCDKCSNHPKNGGSGICHCILGQRTFY